MVSTKSFMLIHQSSMLRCNHWGRDIVESKPDESLAGGARIGTGTEEVRTKLTRCRFYRGKTRESGSPGHNPEDEPLTSRRDPSLLLRLGGASPYNASYREGSP